MTSSVRKNGPATLAETVANLRNLINERQRMGAWKLPPETDLSHQMAVSRSKLREALSRLEAEGLISRRRRAGTTINWGPSSVRYPASVILALSEFLTESGIPYSVRELLVRRGGVDEEVASVFDLPQGTEFYDIARIYDIDGHAAAYVQHYLPTELDGHAINIESFNDAVVTFLEQVEHIALQDVESTVTIEQATADVAPKLGVQEGTALLAMYCTLHDQQSRVVSVGRLLFRSDVVSLSITARGHLRLVR
ncbi:MAG: GntR family transcriptional regulator [Chloroflexota bacterium]|nr:GntR family transcriptional regulator [Chloroflexota bacterium]